MKLIYLTVFLLFANFLSATAQQTNYVATTANASSPGIYNTLVGVAAGHGTTSGSYNTYVGYMSGYFNTSGSNNAFVGFNAGNNNQTGSNNAYFGYGAGVRNMTGSNNTYLGAISGSSGIQSSLNTFVGASTGLNNNGDGNTFIGNQAGQNNQSGGYNVFLGSQAGLANTTGQGNLFLGQQAGGQNTTASYNLFMGNSSGSNTTTGLGNTAIGDGSLLRNNTGIHNVAIGRFAGVENRSDENTFIGFAADVSPNTPNLTNATAIGARARVSQSNTIVLGAGANVAIGNSTPTAKLHLTSSTANTSGLRLENLTSASPASATNQYKFLTVDGSGNVILGSLNGSAREGAVDALWQRKGTLLQSLNGESVVIGSKVDKAPSGYKLFVEDGILTEKVKVAVKNTSEWSDKVFEKGYQLKSLTEVEQYINQSGHLPGVASAKEMVEQGNDLHKTDAKLLEKIEELTLYSIQLEKESQQQKIVNQHLQQNAKSQQAEIDELKQLVKQLLDKR